MSAESWYEQTQSFEFGPHRTVFRRDGKGSALVCIHGFPTSSWDFAPVWLGLTTHFDCIASDLLGLGHASKPTRELTVALQADLIEALCVDQGITEAALFAHDLGATVAQELLARQADGSNKVTWTRCLFLNGGLFPETHRPRVIQKLLLSPLGPLIARLSSERTFRKNMIRIFGANTPPPEDFLRDGWELLDRDNGRKSLPHLIRYIPERSRFRERWVQPMIDGVVPMRFVNGTQDPVSGGHAVDRYEAIIPSPDTVRLDHIGHYPHVEDPDAVLAASLSFLS